MEHTLRMFSLFFVLSGIVCALIILFYIFPKRRQSMKIMEVVWPLTGLWANWPGLWAYLKMGIEKHGNISPTHPPMQVKRKKGMEMKMEMPARPAWQKITLSTLHCGAGCTLADLIGETFTTFVPLAIGGSFLAGQWVLDYILALLIGIYFQYAAIRPMENLPRGKIIAKAFKIDFFSLTAWQIGMYGWMAICMFGMKLYLPHNSWQFWFMMQIAMYFGFLVSYPANWILIRMGIKHGM